MKRFKKLLMTVAILSVLASCASARKDREGFAVDASASAQKAGQYSIINKINDTANYYVYGRILEGDYVSTTGLQAVGIELIPTFNSSSINSGQIEKFTMVMVVKKDNTDAELGVYVQIKDREIPVNTLFKASSVGEHTAGKSINLVAADNHGDANVTGTGTGTVLNVNIIVDGNINFANGFPLLLRNISSSSK